MRCGLIGLGKLGKHLGHSLLCAGIPLGAYDREQDGTTPLLEAGPIRADTPRVSNDQLIDELDELGAPETEQT